MGLNSRLKNLEGLNPESPQEVREDAISKETLSRVTDEDLDILISYLDRRLAPWAAEEPTEEEAPAVDRYERLREEVIHELDPGP